MYFSLFSLFSCIRYFIPHTRRIHTSKWDHYLAKISTLVSATLEGTGTNVRISIDVEADSQNPKLSIKSRIHDNYLLYYQITFKLDKSMNIHKRYRVNMGAHVYIPVRMRMLVPRLIHQHKSSWTFLHSVSRVWVMLPRRACRWVLEYCGLR